MHCALFADGRCRSCSQLAQPYHEQLAQKQAHCRALLADWPDIDWAPPVASPESGFRNKAKMAVGGTIEQPLLGLVDIGGRQVDLQACPLYPPALSASFPAIVELIRTARVPPYDVVARRGELKFVLVTLAEHSGELMLRLVLRSREALGRIEKALPALLSALPTLAVVSVNLQPEPKAVLEGEQEILLHGHRLTMQVGELPLHLAPKSFFQTNTAVAAALYAQARDWLDALAPASLWDLYCGVGGFALSCAAPGRAVTGVELSPEAIASARQSAAELGREVAFVADDAADWARRQQHWPTLVVVNPPRRGIGALAARIEHSDSRWLLYSSCNAASLAADLSRMPSFLPRRARLLDMFPHTGHYELLLLAERAPRDWQPAADPP